MKHSLLLGIGLILILIPHVSASVVISEVLYDPTTNDTLREFVELYNPTAQSINITGWKIEAGNGNTANSWTLQATLSGMIPAYGFYLVGGSLVNGADLRKNLTLQNGPDAVRIKNSTGQIMDLVGYGPVSGFNNSEYYEGSPTVDVPAGHSIERRPGFLSPSQGNGEDTENNSADFLDRSTPEPQNSSVTELPFLTANVMRTLNPQLNSYLPNMVVNVTLAYSFFSPQAGLIIRETNPLGIQNANPQPNVFNQQTGFAKWLLINNTSIPNGTITYSFATPSGGGNYTIAGDWMAVTQGGLISSGSTRETIINILALVTLQGAVEDVFGGPLANAVVSGGGGNSLTTQNGLYNLTLVAGQQQVNASKSGYVTESVILNIFSPMTFNFSGNDGLVPLLVTDQQMLTGVSRWANNFFGDSKLLEVVYQWALTP